jgi:hypothetical protein
VNDALSLCSLPNVGNLLGYFFSGSILYIPVPQLGHTPFKAGRPFFIVTSTALAISFLALHFTQ